MTSELRLRLAALQGDPRIRLGPRPPIADATVPGPTALAAPDGLARLGFRWEPGRELFVRRDRVLLSDLGMSAGAVGLERLGGISPLVPSEASGSLTCFDLETTGLQRGAGTVPFLYGWARVVADAIEVEQWLLPQLGEEAPLVRAALDQLRQAGLLVTYNGTSYDLPLLRARLVMSGVDRPWPGTVHLDLLPVVRRLFGHRLDRCTLRVAEEALLGMHRRHDLPGREAPARYWEYLRTGDPEPLREVTEHNRLDVISLVRLLDRIASHLELESPHPSDWLSLGRFAEARGRLAAADHSYRQAEQLAPPPLDRAGALRRARLLRRQGDPEAAKLAWQSIWERWRDPEAAEALCVHLEHRQGDLEAAEGLARAALAEAPVGWDQRFARRIWRLDAKLGRLRSADPLASPPRATMAGRPWASWLPGGDSYEAWLALRKAPSPRRGRVASAR